MSGRSIDWMNGRNARFGEMTWPMAGDKLSELEHAMRYGTPDRSALLQAASVLSAYWHLVNAPKRKRDYVVAMLRKASARAAADARGEER